MSQRRDARKSLKLAANEIAIDNFQFAPTPLTVQAGTKVTWINTDDVPHLIASSKNAFKASPVVDTDQRFSTTFSTPGTYDYFCALHPKMQGKVVVTPA